jgi:hypothetical protein
LFKLPPISRIVRLIQAVMPMCDKCQQLETRIQRCRKFLSQGLDSATFERINALIQELQERKETIKH